MSSSERIHLLGSDPVILQSWTSLFQTYFLWVLPGVRDMQNSSSRKAQSFTDRTRIHSSIENMYLEPQSGRAFSRVTGAVCKVDR